MEDLQPALQVAEALATLTPADTIAPAPTSDSALDFSSATAQKSEQFPSHHSYRHLQDYNRSLEYSRSLVVQLLTKCAQEHAFRFRIFAVQQEAIERVSRLVVGLGST